MASDLAKARRRILLLMDQNLDFVELLGEAGVIHGVSGAIKALAGYEPAELVGRHYKDSVHPDDLALAEQTFKQVLLEGHSVPATLRYCRKDGSWRTVVVKARSFLDDPALEAIVVFTRDITEQLGAEASLAEANEELHWLTQQLLSAHEDERNYLSRELHDDVMQTLVGITLSMKAASTMSRQSPEEQSIDHWRVLILEAVDRLRRLTRGLRLPVLDQRDLVAQLTAYVDTVRLESELNICLDIAPDLPQLPPAAALACLRIAQEALANAVKHARASRVLVSVSRSGEDVLLTIRDDGCGFDVLPAPVPAGQDGHIGLISMRERAALVGGTLTLDSRPGGGTTITARIPHNQARQAA